MNSILWVRETVPVHRAEGGYVISGGYCTRFKNQVSHLCWVGEKRRQRERDASWWDVFGTETRESSACA